MTDNSETTKNSGGSCSSLDGGSSSGAVTEPSASSFKDRRRQAQGQQDQEGRGILKPGSQDPEQLQGMDFAGRADGLTDMPPNTTSVTPTADKGPSGNPAVGNSDDKPTMPPPLPEHPEANAQAKEAIGDEPRPKPEGSPHRQIPKDSTEVRQQDNTHEEGAIDPDSPYISKISELPACFAGRDGTSEIFKTRLAEIIGGDVAQSMVMLGIRYIGKSTMLLRLQKIAGAHGDTVEAHEFSCSWIESITKQMEEFVNARLIHSKYLRTAKSGAGLALKFVPHWSAEMFAKFLESLPESSVDFARRYIKLGLELKESNRCMAFFIDNVDEASFEDLKFLLAVLQITDRENLPILYVLTAHPDFRARMRQANRRAHDLLETHTLGRLTADEVRAALDRSAREFQREFSQEALDEMAEICNGYPYLVPLLAQHVWEKATARVMDIDDVHEALPAVRAEVMGGMLESRWKHMSPEQHRFVLAMASLPATRRTLGNIATNLGGVKEDHIKTIDELLADDIIYVYNENLMDFTVPMFEEYLLKHKCRTGRLS